MTRFDVVAIGDTWGRASIDNPDFRSGPYGWTFDLVSGASWRDRIPPSRGLPPTR
jgi:hypothetical protein